MKIHTQIEPGAPALNPDGDLCVVLSVWRGARRSTAQVAVLPGALHYFSGDYVSLKRRRYPLGELLLLRTGGYIDPGKEKAAAKVAEAAGFGRPRKNRFHFTYMKRDAAEVSGLTEPEMHDQEQMISDLAGGWAGAISELTRRGTETDTFAAGIQRAVDYLVQASGHPDRLSNTELQAAIDTIAYMLEVQGPVMGSLVFEVLHQRLDPLLAEQVRRAGGGE